MPQIVNLSSSAVNSAAGNFTTTFSQPLDLDDPDYDYEVGIVDGILWNSPPNISAALNNNTLTYNNGSSDKVVTFDDGVYGVNDIENALANAMTLNGDDPTKIVIVGFSYSSKVQFQITSPYTVTLPLAPVGLPKRTIAYLLGFTTPQQGIALTTTTTGLGVADISNGFSSFLINFPGLVDGSTVMTNGNTSSAIFNASWEYPPNARNPLTIYYPSFVKVTQKIVQNIVCIITNQNGGQPLDFNQKGNYQNNSTSLVLLFQKVPKSARKKN